MNTLLDFITTSVNTLARLDLFIWLMAAVVAVAVIGVISLLIRKGGV